jgi:Lon protease-like protein
MLLFLTPALGAAQVRSAGSLPEAIPIFPLPDATLFPNSTQPFHIFEPRYRAMIADALAGDSIIGMVTLQPGFEADYEGRPPVYAVGCAGVIVASEQLGDGRYNIVLRGLTKFRILGEDQSRLYRLADVESIQEAVADDDREELSQRRRQLEAAVLSAFPNAQLPPADLSDEALIDALALALPMEPVDRQAVLEADGPLERAAALVAHLRAQGRSSI